MSKKKYVLLLAVIALAGVTTGCGFIDFLQELIRNAGFSIHSTASVRQSGRTRVVDYPFARIAGDRIRDFAGAGGQIVGFGVITDEHGRSLISGGRAPALWRFIFRGDLGDLNLCPNQETYGFPSPLSTVDVFCPVTIGIFFTASPDTIDVQSPPQTVTVYGQGIDTTYGMPLIEFWDDYGNVVAQTSAVEVAPDGTWARGNVPAMDTSNMYGGYYTVGINNWLGDGTYDTVGYASLTVTNSNPPPLPEPDPTPEPDPCGGGGGTYDQPMMEQPCYNY